MKKYQVKGADAPSECVLIPGMGRITHRVEVRYTDGSTDSVSHDRLIRLPNKEDVTPSALDESYSYLFE